jgi:hypothetical protein
MADGTVEAVGVAGKAGAAGLAGAMWGIFATFFLLIPAAVGLVAAPFAKKAKDKITEKINTVKSPPANEASQGTKSKAEAEFQRRMDILTLEREEALLAEQMAAAAERRNKLKTRTVGRSKPQDNRASSI